MDTSETQLGAAQDGLGSTDDDVAELSRSLEALLFMSGEALGLQDLCELTERTPEQIGSAIDALAEACEGRAVRVVRVAGGFQLVTRPQYGEIVAKLLQPKRFRLSRAALETLAIVAYKQPVTRPEIEEIRGVNVDGVMETLLQYELIRECGRRRSPGRPIQYGTSDNFLIHFGLNSLQDLPDLDRLGRQDVVETEQEDQLGEGKPEDVEGFGSAAEGAPAVAGADAEEKDSSAFHEPTNNVAHDQNIARCAAAPEGSASAEPISQHTNGAVTHPMEQSQ
jgi:segregation and condensation protein B